MGVRSDNHDVRSEADLLARDPVPFEELTADELPPLESDIVALAEVYRCRPDDLVAAAGRQLRRADGVESPVNEHSDVLALEAIARVLRLVRSTEAEALPEVPDSSLTLARHVSHVKACDVCARGVERYLALFPRSGVDWDDLPVLNRHPRSA